MPTMKLKVNQNRVSWPLYKTYYTFICGPDRSQNSIMQYKWLSFVGNTLSNGSDNMKLCC